MVPFCWRLMSLEIHNGAFVSQVTLPCDLLGIKAIITAKENIGSHHESLSNSLKPKIICLCQEEWLASTRASPTSLSSPHSPSGSSLAPSLVSFLSWDGIINRVLKSFHLKLLPLLLNIPSFCLESRFMGSSLFLPLPLFSLLMYCARACLSLWFCSPEVCLVGFSIPVVLAISSAFEITFCPLESWSLLWLILNQEVKKSWFRLKMKTCCLIECVLFPLADGIFDTLAFSL